MAPSVDVDSASLREALAVIDDCKDELLGLFDLGDSTTQGPARQFAPYPPRRSQKTQLTELRRELKHLEALDSAWLTKSQHSDAPADVLGLRIECWEMSRRQRIQRKQAQQENANLRELLTSAKFDLLKVERLLQRALSIERELPRTLVLAPFLKAYKGPCVEFPEQLFRLELLRAEMERVFSSGMFSQKADQEGFKEVRIRDCFERIEVLFSAVWDLPFDLDAVEAAMWSEMTRTTQQQRTLEWMDLYVNDSVTVSQFISTPFDANDPGVKHGQAATRRLPRSSANNEAAIVSTVQICKFEHGGSRHAGCVDVWVRLRRLPTKCGPRTQIKWCRRASINPPNAGSKVLWIQSLLSGSFREQEERHLDWSVQAVENALLDRRHSTPTSIC